MSQTALLFEQMRNISVAILARQLGLQLSNDNRCAGPCPICGAQVRSKSKRDSRLPIGFRADGYGWECQHCHDKGDGIDLAALVIGGSRYRELSQPQRAYVREWFVSEYFINETPKSNYRRNATNSFRQPLALKIHAQKQNSPPVTKIPTRPPIEEVMNLWEQCIGVTQDTEAIALIESWNIDVGIVYIKDLARVLPVNGPRFSWMRARGQDWHQGWRLIVPAYGATGKIESLKSRWIRSSNPPNGLKSTSPKGYQVKNLVTVEPLANAILERGELPLNIQNWPQEQRFDIWIAEGEKDLISKAAQYNQHSYDIYAVFGTWAGGWTDDIAARIPTDERIRIIIATDSDEAGDNYAKKIYKTLITRGFRAKQLVRWKSD